jgi:hypothetical protein
MPRGRSTRKRRTKTQWTEILRQFDSSGLSSSEFCRRQRLAPSSFQRWRRRLGAVSKAEFVELVPTAVPAAPPSDWTLDIALPNGVCLRFRG